jgi:molecular chaperone DnaJ
MDLYRLLGLGRDATSAEIDRAYRRLARRFHPGLNPGDHVAAEMYAQILGAYAVLSDVERRGDYDRGGRAAPQPGQDEVTVSFQGFDFSAPAEGGAAATFSELFADVFQDAAREATTPTRGGDIELVAHLSFEDAARGGSIPVSIVRRERCASCLGDGRTARPSSVCPACRGEGTRRWARGHMVFASACETCDGDGRVSSDACRMCAGAGVAQRSEVVTFVVPPGIDGGARIAVPGRGHAGARGGPAGDLYVTIDVAEHPFFRRTGRDLWLTLPVAVHEAALGARVDVPTLDAEPVQLRIPPGTASGTRLRLRGRGIPAPNGDPDEAGDLIADVHIVLPAVTDQRSKELLREFGQINNIDVRRDLFREAERGGPSTSSRDRRLQ